MGASRERITIASALAILLGLWWVPFLWHRGTEVERYVNFDLLAYVLPLVREAGRQWLEGAAPLWNPYQGLGGPLLATQQVGAAYPPNAIYLLLGVGSAWWVSGLLHHAIAIGGAYAFCRSLALTPKACVVGAAAYGFSRILVGRHFDQPAFICLAWLPVMFACAERLVGAPTRRHAAALAAVWALQILGGHPGTIVHSGLLLLAFAGVRLASSGREARHVVAATFGVAAVAALALGLAAFQLLPTLELAQESVRRAGALSVAQQTVLSVTPRWLVTGVPFQAPLVLAVLALLQRGRRSVTWFFGVTLVVSGLLAMGGSTPLFHAFRHLPFGTWFRAPVRFLDLWPLCFAVLAAASTHRLLQYVRGVDVSALLWPLAGAAGALAFLRIAVADDVRNALAAAAFFDLLPLAVAGLAAAARTRAPNLREWMTALVLLAVCAVPAFYIRDYKTALQMEESYAELEDVFAQIRPYEPARTLSFVPYMDLGPWAKLGTYHRVQLLNEHEPLVLETFRRFADGLRGNTPRSLRDAMGVFMGEVVPPRGRYRGRLLNLSGVRFVVGERGTAAARRLWFDGEVKLQPWWSSERFVIHENSAALPRAFFVQLQAAYRPDGDCTEHLLSETFDPAAALLLETAPPAGSTSLRAGGDVRVRRYGPREIRLRVSAEARGFVVLTDAFYPGWAGWIDDTPTAVLRADCFFRAVEVPAGEHDVVLRYRPLSFSIGCVVSAIALIVALMLARGRRQLRPTPPRG